MFYAVRGGQVDIYTVAPGGGDVTNLTGDAPPDSDPKWSPDGSRIAFDSRRGNGERNIWIRDLADNYTQLTTDTGSVNAFPTWSPDGSQIAYEHDGQIWVMNADGSNQHSITSGADDSRPSWSHDDVIAFFRTTPNGQGGNDHTVWTVPAAGGTPQVLLNVDAGGGRQPSWSPDGSKLAYAKLVKGVLRIYTVKADGSSQKALTPGDPCPCQFPTWSPNGSQIAFQAGPSRKEQIYVVGANGGSVKRLTDGSGQNLVPGWAT